MWKAAETGSCTASNPFDFKITNAEATAEVLPPKTNWLGEFIFAIEMPLSCANKGVICSCEAFTANIEPASVEPLSFAIACPRAFARKRYCSSVKTSAAQRAVNSPKLCPAKSSALKPALRNVLYIPMLMLPIAGCANWVCVRFACCAFASSAEKTGIGKMRSESVVFASFVNKLSNCAIVS